MSDIVLRSPPRAPRARVREVEQIEAQIRKASSPEERVRLEGEKLHLQCFYDAGISGYCMHVPRPACLVPLYGDYGAPNHGRAEIRHIRETAEVHIANLCFDVLDRFPDSTLFRHWEVRSLVLQECDMFQPALDVDFDAVPDDEVTAANARSWMLGVLQADERFKLERVRHTVKIGGRPFDSVAVMVSLIRHPPDDGHDFPVIATPALAEPADESIEPK